MREVREELGRTIRVTGRIGEAVQAFFATEAACWYEMTAVFLNAELNGQTGGPVEHDLCWLDPIQDGASFFHACHAWAAPMLGA